MTSLARGRAPNYRLKEAYADLEQGTFVRPVELYHLPPHVVKDLGWAFNAATEIACYTSKGFKVIPRRLLEET